MFTYFKPNFFFHTFKDITEEFIKENGIRTILSDLDGTLAPENEGSYASFEEWLTMIEKLDVSLVVVSNNNQERVDRFTKPNHLIGFGKCSKPFGKKIETEMFERGLNPNTTLFLGDQLFTDVWCGKRLGVRTALVNPIPGEETWKTKIKRRPEKWLLTLWGVER